MLTVTETDLFYTEIAASGAGLLCMLALLLAAQCGWTVGRQPERNSSGQISMKSEYLPLGWFAFAALAGRMIPLLLELDESYPDWYIGATYSRLGGSQEPQGTFAYFGYWLCFETAASTVGWLYFFALPTPIAIQTTAWLAFGYGLVASTITTIGFFAASPTKQDQDWAPSPAENQAKEYRTDLVIAILPAVQYAALFTVNFLFGVQSESKGCYYALTIVLI